MALTAKFTKRLGKFQLQVDLAAESDAPLALLGTSGCGKSVTLKCIAGILRPDSGEIVLDGQILFNREKRIDLPPQKRHIGYLFQQYALFPNMTVAQNIAAGAHVLDKKERAERIQKLASLFRLEGLENHRPSQLSGGQQQRTALARMMAAEPRAILLDEPFAALDSYLRWQLEMELQDVIARFGGSVLWVSHDRGEIYRSCVQVCVLENGRSAPVTNVKNLMANPGTVSAARLSGCKNYISVQPGPGPGLVTIPAWGLTLRTNVPWREGVTTLGIRANHVCPAKMTTENAFFCETVRVTEDVFTMLVMLRPMGAAQDSALLRMELGKEAWEAVPDKKQLAVAVPPDHLLLLE